MLAILIALGFSLLLRFGSELIFEDVRLPWWFDIGSYLISFVVVDVVLKSRKQRKSGDTTLSLPASGPLGKGAPWLIYPIFLSSALLSIFNPLQLAQQVSQLGGQLIIWLRLRGNFPNAESYEQKTAYRLPFRGKWLAMNGGVTKGNSHSWGVLTQRYAYDFVQVDAQLARHTGSGTKLEDYYCWDQPILAAADGVVVDLRDGVRTAPWLGSYAVDFLSSDFRGNFVMIEHAEAEYGFYAHLIAGKIVVKVGEKVKAGQEIGRCGHSGNSTEPHLHFHIQDRSAFYLGIGLPVKLGAGFVSKGEMVTGSEGLGTSQ